MYFSKYNIFSRIRESEQYFIVNLLSGNADILSPEEAARIDAIRRGGIPGEDDFIRDLSEKGYLTDPEEEKKRYSRKYLDFIDDRENDETQIFFVPNYSCNFACSYCYQESYVNTGSPLTTDMVDAFFTYIRKEFAGRKKYITIFGGEPLLSSPKQKELISYTLQKASEANLEVCIVTNGYNLFEYIGILQTALIREVQVTLDGTAEVHNARRFLKGGGPTFDNIIQGIDACLANHIPVNLRMVADKENIDNLPQLADFAIGKGWTKSPYFKTQIGRNYELHSCQSTSDKLFDRVSLYEKLYGLVMEHPTILEFYKPAFSIAKFLQENGSLPDPLFDSCPACKTEWAFDYTGQIYPCTATVGKAGEALGTYYPEITRNQPLISEWEMRDVTAIAECKDCNLQLACGGGCGSVAKNNTGKVCSADCRPIKELLELGFKTYF